MNTTKTPAELGLEAAVRLKNIEIAELQIKFWTERYSYAASQIERWRGELSKREKISREGGE